MKIRFLRVIRVYYYPSAQRHLLLAQRFIFFAPPRLCVILFSLRWWFTSLSWNLLGLCLRSDLWTQQAKFNFILKPGSLRAPATHPLGNLLMGYLRHPRDPRFFHLMATRNTKRHKKNFLISSRLCVWILISEHLDSLSLCLCVSLFINSIFAATIFYSSHSNFCSLLSSLFSLLGLFATLRQKK